MLLRGGGAFTCVIVGSFYIATKSYCSVDYFNFNEEM